MFTWANYRAPGVESLQPICLAFALVVSNPKISNKPQQSQAIDKANPNNFKTKEVQTLCSSPSYSVIEMAKKNSKVSK